MKPTTIALLQKCKQEKKRRACRQAAQRSHFTRHKCHPSVHSKITSHHRVARSDE